MMVVRLEFGYARQDSVHEGLVQGRAGGGQEVEGEQGQTGHLGIEEIEALNKKTQHNYILVSIIG